MQKLPKGTYLGKGLTEFHSFGCTLGICEYDPATYSNWHDHETSYFAYIIKGGNIEIRQNSELECPAGTLLFCKAGDVHKNINYKPRTRILYAEFDNAWYEHYKLKPDISDQYHIVNPHIQNIFGALVSELTNPDTYSGFITEGLLLQAYGLMQRTNNKNYKAQPDWVSRLKQYLEAKEYEPSLSEAAKAINVHPVTLSKDFMKYFGSNFSEFMQKKKLQKSVSLLCRKSLPLETVAFESGFADASHYIKLFKKYFGITPSEYRRRLSH